VARHDVLRCDDAGHSFHINRYENAHDPPRVVKKPYRRIWATAAMYGNDATHREMRRSAE